MSPDIMTPPGPRYGETPNEAVLRKALENLAREMRAMLRANPKKDGGLYRQRLTEAEEALAAPEPHGAELERARRQWVSGQEGG